jgi:hypothetical protein
VGVKTAEYKELPELNQDVHPEQVLEKIEATEERLKPKAESD